MYAHSDQNDLARINGVESKEIPKDARRPRPGREDDINALGCVALQFSRSVGALQTKCGKSIEASNTTPYKGPSLLLLHKYAMDKK